MPILQKLMFCLQAERAIHLRPEAPPLRLQYMWHVFSKGAINDSSWYIFCYQFTMDASEGNKIMLFVDVAAASQSTKYLGSFTTTGRLDYFVEPNRDILISFILYWMY